MKTKKQKPYICLGPIITLGIMFVLYAISGIYPFGSLTTAFSDGFSQYIPFLTELKSKFVEGDSFFFTWHVANGSNFWAIISYYLASPLNLIALFFPVENMDEAFSIITLIKPSIMALTFSIFLKHTYKKNDLSLAIFSILWALSGFMIGGNFITSWYDAIIWFPLVIMGLQKMMDGKSAWQYSLFLGLTIVSNFYMGWMTCIFSVIYFIYTFISNDEVLYDGVTGQEGTEDEAINVFVILQNSYLLKSGFKFAFSSLLAGGISAIMVLPFASALQNTGKGTVTESTFSFSGDGIFGIFASHIFPFKNNITTLGSTECIFAFCGIATIILTFAYFFTKGISKRQKLGNLFLLIIMWLSIIFHVFYFVWHGFGEPVGIMYRFAFIYSFVLLKIAIEAYCNLEKLSKFSILIGTAFALFCIVSICLNNMFKVLFASAELVIAIVAFIAIFTAILLLYKKFKSQKVFTIILLVCVVIESIVFNVNNLNTMDVEEPLEEYEIIELLEPVIKENEKACFSSGNTTYKDMLMYGAMYGYNSYESYSSLSDGDFTITMNNFGSYSNYLNMQNGAIEQTPVFNMMFPTKYYVDGTNRITETTYRTKIADNGKYILYQNNYTMPFMYTISGNIVDWSPFSYPIIVDNLNAVAKTISNTNENVTTYNVTQNFSFENCKKISAADRVDSDNENAGTQHSHDHDDIESTTSNEYAEYYEFLENRMYSYSYEVLDMKIPAYVTFDSVAQADGIMYIYVDTRELTDLTITLNGKTIEYNLFGMRDGTVYELGEVKKGDVATIRIGGYRDNGLENGNVYVLQQSSFTATSFTVDMENFQNAYNKLDAMSDTEMLEFSDTYVKAKVTSFEDGLLYIPTSYDEGWTILIDGVETPLYEHESHILMTAISKGEHIVEMKYCPVGFVPGAIITSVSVVILVAWAIIATKRFKKEEEYATINETSVNEE